MQISPFYEILEWENKWKKKTQEEEGINSHELIWGRY